MRSSQIISEFKRKLLKLIRPPKRSIFNIYDLEGIKLLTQLRVEFSDLRCHRYRHNFHCASPTCLCQTGIEDNEYFLLHCPRFSLQCRFLLELVSKSADVDIMRLSSNELTNVLLNGHSEFTVVTNRTIIEATLKFIRSTERSREIDTWFAPLNHNDLHVYFLSFYPTATNVNNLLNCLSLE